MSLPQSAYIHRVNLVDSEGTQSEGVNKVAMYVWDTGTLQWVKATPATSGGAGAVTIGDGADLTEGAIGDAAVFGNSAGTLSAKLRGINALTQGIGSANAPATASVSAVDGVVLAANASRRKAVITNLGSVNVFFGDGQAAALNSGIVLTPSGVWVMDSYTFTTADIHAICSSSATLAIQEYQ